MKNNVREICRIESVTVSIKHKLFCRNLCVGIILCIGPANDRRFYNVTSFLTDQAHAQNDHWCGCAPWEDIDSQLGNAMHYIGVIMSTAASKPFIRAQIKENIKAPRHWSLWYWAGMALFCEGYSLGTGEFPAQKASNAENASIWWYHHVQDFLCIARQRWARPYCKSSVI